jgi:hypothetical protein
MTDKEEGTQNIHPILAFYRQLTGATDAAGRTLAKIWNFDNEQLEAVHDYIQWLFPLREASRFNPDAPLLTDEVIAAFREDKSLRDKLLYSFDLMLDFFGLKQVKVDNTLVTSKNEDYPERKPVWVDSPKEGYLNHNLLRVSRILACLSILGLEEEAKSFLHFLENTLYPEEIKHIGARTLDFWQKAVNAR